MTYQEALKVIKAVATYYQNFSLTEEKVREWGLVIQEYELNQVMENLRTHVRKSQFPPAISDLIKQDESTKRIAYLPNTVESMHIQAEEARQFLEAIEGNQERLGIRPSGREELAELMKNLKGGK
jgi:hypothetical protein